MTTTELATEALALAKENEDKVFDLPYYPWRPQDTARVILLRHVNPEPEADDFTCHDATTGEHLGWGEDKDEAQSKAAWELTDRAREAEGFI